MSNTLIYEAPNVWEIIAAVWPTILTSVLAGTATVVGCYFSGRDSLAKGKNVSKEPGDSLPKDSAGENLDDVNTLPESSAPWYSSLAQPKELILTCIATGVLVLSVQLQIQKHLSDHYSKHTENQEKAIKAYMDASTSENSKIAKDVSQKILDEVKGPIGISLQGLEDKAKDLTEKSDDIKRLSSKSVEKATESAEIAIRTSKIAGDSLTEATEANKLSQRALSPAKVRYLRGTLSFGFNGSSMDGFVFENQMDEYCYKVEKLVQHIIESRTVELINGAQFYATGQSISPNSRSIFYAVPKSDLIQSPPFSVAEVKLAFGKIVTIDISPKKLHYDQMAETLSLIDEETRQKLQIRSSQDSSLQMIPSGVRVGFLDQRHDPIWYGDFRVGLTKNLLSKDYFRRGVLINYQRSIISIGYVFDLFSSWAAAPLSARELVDLVDTVYLRFNQDTAPDRYIFDERLEVLKANPGKKDYKLGSFLYLGMQIDGDKWCNILEESPIVSYLEAGEANVPAFLRKINRSDFKEDEIQL